MPYLTRDSAAADTVCRTFRIPSNFLPDFMGALYELSLPYRWEQFGTLTPDETAELFRELIDTYREGCMIGIAFEYITENPPDGSIALDGSTYDDVDYPLLVANLDPNWSNGDGTFTLPDVRGRVVVGAGAGVGLTNRAVGDLFGTETHALSSNQNGQHAHGYLSPQADLLVVAPGEAPGSSGIGAPLSTDNSGLGDAHPNIQPSIALPMAVWYR